MRPTLLLRSFAPFSVALLAAALLGAVACHDAPTAPTAVPDLAPRADAAAQRELAGLASPHNYYVDPGLVGSDANPGTAARPFRTLHHALAAAARGDTVRLAAGQYVAGIGGEQYPASVPAGVVVRGTLASGGPAPNGAKRTFLVAGAASPDGLTLGGGAVVQDLEMDGFNVGVQAAAGAQTVRNVGFVLDKISVLVLGTARTTVENGTIYLNSGDSNARAAYVGEQGTLVFATGRVDGSAAGCGKAEGFVLRDGARATIGNVSTPLPITNVGGSALVVEDSAAAVLSPVHVKQTLPASCFPWATVRLSEKGALTMKSSVLQSVGGSHAVGIDDASTGPLVLDGSAIVTYSGIGIRATGHAKIDVRSSTNLFENVVGIDARTMTSTNPLDLTIRNSLVLSTSIAILAPTLTMRGTSLSGHLGLEITGTSPDVNAGPDLGTSASPGGNELVDTELGVGFWNGSAAVGIVRASGNTWRKSTQGSDAAGHYAAGVHVTGTSANAVGANFRMENAKTEIRF